MVTDEEGASMVIVEGCDGSGKTILVRRLCEALKVEAMPKISKSDTAVDRIDLREWIQDDLQDGMKPGSGLYDRYPLISELIYGPVVRGHLPEGFDQWWLRAMLGKLDRLHPLIVFCIPPFELVKANVMSSHEGTTPHLRGVIQHLEGIYELYRVRAALNFSLTRDNRYRHLVWDYSDPGKSSFDLLLEWAAPKVLYL